MPQSLTDILIVVAAVFLLWLVIRLFRKPIRWILKLLLTILTLAIGYQGWEVTPLFSIGASLGIVFGGILSISPVYCAALGYAAVFAGATNTLLAPVLIGLEVFGANDMVPFLIVCIFAYLVNGDKSIYGAQEVRK